MAQGHHVQRVDGFEHARITLLAYLALPRGPDLPPFTLRPFVAAEKSTAPRGISKARVTDYRPKIPLTFNSPIHQFLQP